MRKAVLLKTILLFSFFFICQIIYAQYCTNSANKSRSDRYLSSFVLLDESSSLEITGLQSGTNASQPVYYDKTSSVFNTSPGASITLNANWTGAWMHGFIYIDFDKDGTFTPDINADGSITDLSELRGYSASESTGSFKNSLGQSVGGNVGVNLPAPFTIPTDLTPGTYRARFKIDWSNINPCGDSGIGNNGGSITDFTIVVTEPTPIRTIKLEVAESGGGTVTGGGTKKGAITCQAIPEEGYIFAKWIDKDTQEVVSINKIYSDNTPGDKTFIAVFIQPAVKPNSHIVFSGGQYIRIANTADLRKTTEENYSISLWVRLRNFSANANNRILGFRNGNSPSGYEMYSYRKGYGFLAPQSSSTFIFDDSFNGVNDQWVHFVAVFDQSSVNNYMYINGEKKNSSKINGTTSTISQTLDLLLGAGWSSGVAANFFVGDLANVRIYKKALTPEEAVADGANDFEDLPESLKDVCSAAYKLIDNYTSSIVTDLTGRGNNGTMINFPTYTSNGTIQSVYLSQNQHLTGRGNEYDYVLESVVNFTGPATKLIAANVSLKGTTDISDINKVKIYTTGTNPSFDERTAEGATLLGEATPTEGNFTVTFDGDQTISQGVNYLWLVTDISMQAKEGNKVDATFNSLTSENETFNITNNDPDGYREIILIRKLLYAPGDQNVSGYRIPAMDLLPNGDIITAIDQRFIGEDDLPTQINLISLRSEDGGYTWKDQAMLSPYTNSSNGKGDVAVLTADNGDVIAAFIGDGGIFTSSVGSPLASYISRSTDGGRSWSPVSKGGEGDITNIIWGPQCQGDAYRLAARSAFFGSGKGLLLKRQTGENSWKNGRIMFVSAVYNGSVFASYIVYSDDHGKTWKVSSQAYYGSDESKVTELSDGTILLSVRQNGARGYNRSSDGGETWGTQGTWSQLVTNACNGSILELTATADGYDKNRTIQSLPINDGGKVREKVSMYISYDEGYTWTREKQLFPGNSGYSTTVKFPDGTIGVYAEDQYDQVSNYFMRFSLEWMTSGKDKYQPIASRTITLETSPENSGTLTGGGTNEGSMLCHAEANDGYEFVNWTVKETGAKVSSCPTYLENIAGNKTLVANFVKLTPTRTITLEVNPEDAGTVEGGGTADGHIVCKATANSGYIFINWTDKATGNVISTEASHTDDIEGDHTLVANFLKIATAPNSYITFNGVDQYIKTPTSVDIEKATGENISISFWINSPMTEHQRPFSYRINGATESFYEMYTNPSGFGVILNNGGTNKLMDDFMENTSGQANKWTHLTIVADVNEPGVRYYVNGTPYMVNRGNTNLSIINSGALILGAQRNLNASTESYRHFLNGSLANMRIYKKALTLTDVVMDGNFEYDELPEELKSSCVLSYKLDNNNLNPIITDQTGRANDGTLYGFTTTSIISSSTNSEIIAIVDGDKITLLGTDNNMSLNVYSATGNLILSKIADNHQTTVTLTETGVFIIIVGDAVMKIVK